LPDAADAVSMPNRHRKEALPFTSLYRNGNDNRCKAT
jgi:hypothetical protein